MIALFFLSALGGLAYVRIQGDRDAKRSALHDATFAAASASKLVGSGARILQGVLLAAVADPAANRQLLADPAGCQLSYAPVGAFPVGHIDFLRSSGAVLCSSLGPAAAHSSGYQGQGWIAAARVRPLSLAPVRDPATGRAAALFTVPFAGGIGVAFVELRSIAPALVSELAAPRGLEYVVTSADGRVALSSSVQAARWAGAPLQGTPFLRSRGSERPGIAGRPRFFAERRVAALGWRVYAGVDRTVALAAAGSLFDRDLALILGTLVVFVAAAVLVRQRIARPIDRLQREMRAEADGGEVAAASASGPSELVALTESFQELRSRVQRELVVRERAEEAARTAETEAREAADGYRLLFESNPQPMWIYDGAGLEIFEVNEAALELYGYSREEFLSLTLADLRPPEEVPAMLERVASIGTDGPWRSPGPSRHTKHDGSVIEVESVSHTVTLRGRQGRLVMVTDVSERERLQRQLAQVQRLESLGQLAGGVAHDFNNLLAVIINYAAFVREEVTSAAEESEAARWAAVRSDAEQVEHAARRASVLTRQLLAFARREVVHPTVVTLNDLVAEIEQLLRRTLGAHIELTCSLANEPWRVLADPGQLERVLVNLAVNARDAMPDGGALVIETANVEVDDSYAFTRPGLEPGPYVRLRVSDNGEGMDAATVERAFEPFFTTKPKGEGTGLGLATIYGIVSQAGGRVGLYSELGVGTTCTIMLPATDELARVPDRTLAEGLGGSGEVVLLVEDEDAIRDVARRILVRRGYEVLSASSGPEAIELSLGHRGAIDLLLTDVIMPKMMGAELAERILETRPRIRVLYMSGYARPILGPQHKLPEGMLLVDKPFSEEALLIKIREALAPTSTSV